MTALFDQDEVTRALIAAKENRNHTNSSLLPTDNLQKPQPRMTHHHRENITLTRRLIARPAPVC